MASLLDVLGVLSFLLAPLLLILVFIVLPAVLMLWGAWHGMRRAGYDGAWVLVLLIPLVNLIMMYVFAFSTWPIESRTVRERRPPS